MTEFFKILIIVSLVFLVLGTISFIVQKNRKSRTTSCRDCRGTVSFGAEKCPHCGAQIPAMGTTGFSIFSVVKGILIGIAIASFLVAGVALVSIIK